ncbi:von Willebrand factor type A domain-containing protein [Mycena capillaripes]|nr:von Willebrand factor type A domain-containing protein [Mycena capillaripes]
MSHIPWGLYYSSENRSIALPLLHVKVDASLKELSAQDGTRVVGLVEEKGEAREIYEAAVAQGKQAALMEQQTPDVFQLAVGNIQPQEKVQIELIYATELTEDEENDSARFHLPVHIGARYGHAPETLVENASSQNESSFLEISVNVEAVAPIAQIACPSHTVSTELGPDPALPNAKDLPFSNYARVSLSSAAALDKDFVLTVKSAGLDAPRCVAELHPIHSTTALAFTLVPRFKLPDVPRQEFIFLVDRSGSMQGRRITAAKKALIVMLRSLPTKDSLVQIASFGTSCTTLWQDGSRAYNQATLDYATEHVDSISANYGGTEIRAALKTCFEARKTDRPTSVFVLTDGDAWDLDRVFKEVKAAVTRAPASGYLRVSVLGIGNSASTAMCEGIARVGNGTCMMVGEQETSFTGKIARMLKAARTPLITDIELDWGAPSMESLTPVDEDDAFVVVSDGEEEGDYAAKGKGKEKEKAPLNIFDDTVDPMQLETAPVPPPPKIVLAAPPQAQQSPFKIRTLSPGNRLNVYAILQGKTVPTTVTLTGRTEDGNEIKLSVLVTLSNLPNAKDSPPAIHALAARKVIQDIEDGQHDLTNSIPDDADLLARTVKESIVRLAKKYSISSSQTSFVAVNESGTQPGSRNSEQQRESKSTSDASPPTRGFGGFAALPPMGRFQPQRFSSQERYEVAQRLSPTATPFGGSKRTRSKRGETRPTRPTGDASLASLPQPTSGDIHTVVTANHGESRLKSSQERYEAAPQQSQLGFSRLRVQSSGWHEPPAEDPSMDPVEKLARLQSFDGRFVQAVLSIMQLNVAADEARAALGVPEDVFATLMGMAFLCTKLDSDVQRESWEAIYDKARTFVEDALQSGASTVGVDELQAQAVGYLA